MTRFSCHCFRANEVRLAQSLLAYNLGNLWRRLALPRRIENRSLILYFRNSGGFCDRKQVLAIAVAIGTEVLVTAA